MSDPEIWRGTWQLHNSKNEAACIALGCQDLDVYLNRNALTELFEIARAVSA